MIQLLGKPVADLILTTVREKTQSFIQQHHRRPKLAVILVGEDPASIIYTRRKGEKAKEIGMDHETLVFPAWSEPKDVYLIIQKLNLDPNVDGILIQRPLPKSFSEADVLYWVTPEKDVDAFHPLNTGRLFLGLPGLLPCTPHGVMKLLDYYKINPSGKLACVIGRSSIVGKPMTALLTQADATLIHCNSKTPQLSKLTLQADILIVAAGKLGLIDRTYVKVGATVIDVGIHRNTDGQIRGDVLYEDVAPVASAITPVPGGVGVMTIAILMQNTLIAAELREKKQFKTT